MDSVETEITDTSVSLGKVYTPKADMDRYLRNALKHYRVPADRVTVIKLAIRDRRPDKATRMKVDNVGNDPFNREAEAREKRVKKSLARDARIKTPGSVFAPIDCMGSPQEREAMLRRLDAEDVRKGPLKQDAEDVEEDENAEGSASNPVDLTSTKNIERVSFRPASRKARVTGAKTKRSGTKGSR